MKQVVLDSSVALTWAFEDEQSDAADVLVRSIRPGQVRVPSLWFFETANGLLSAVRRNRLSFEEALHVRKLLVQLPVSADLPAHGATFNRTLELAHQFDLSVYDAAYLEVADRLELPLATLDRRLARACKANGGSLLLDEPA